MNRIFISLLLIFCTSISFSQEMQALIVNDELIETNLTDNLRTKIKFRKSRNIDINRLIKLSRITDQHKRRRLRMTNSLSISSMSISEILGAKIFTYNEKPYALTKRGILNTLTTTNIYVNNLSPVIFMQKYQIGQKNQLLTKLNAIKLHSIGNVFAGVSLTDSISLLNASKLQILDSSINNIDMTIDRNVYIIDSSIFNVVITEQILKELARDTAIFSYEKSKQFDIAYFKDLKNLEIDKYYEWISFLNQYIDLDIEFIKNTNQYRIIGEVKIENDRYDQDLKQQMIDNLMILKQHDYDSVLVRFDCSQNLDLIIQMINDIRSTGLRVYTVYVGLDNRKPIQWNPFVDPKTIENYISKIAPLSDGWLLNWRSTSAHVKLLPKEFFNYICATVRKYNKSCLIYGEIYYGRIDPLRTTALIYNIPKNVTGVVINNMGYYGYNHQFIVNKMFINSVPNYRKLDKIGQVIGYRPYYSSKENLYLETREEYAYKKKIEHNFNRVRCGTVTMLHDGVDDNYAEDISLYQSQDNIMYDVKIKNLIKENK